MVAKRLAECLRENDIVARIGGDEFAAILENFDDWKEAVAFAGERNSSGLVILANGKILAEQYWDVPAPQRKPSGARNPYAYLLQGKNAAGRAIDNYPVDSRWKTEAREDVAEVAA